jgi:hypothetical protein
VRAAAGVSAAFVYGPALHKASGCATETAVRGAAGRHKVSPNQANKSITAPHINYMGSE